MGREERPDDGSDATMLTQEAASAQDASQAERSQGCAVVGLGASAGGLEALEEFLANTPEDGGVAFVVVTHQHSGQSSMLAELLGRQTRMPVTQVSKRGAVEPNHVYLPEPGKQLSILGNTLLAVDPEPGTSPRLPIDRFFRSLAHDRKERAIGVVLSGTGSDGTLGLKEIKAALGMTLAQEERTARYSAMPRSAIASEAVDLVLAPAEMPEHIVAYVRGLPSTGVAAVLESDGEPPVAMEQLLALLRDRTGQDFSLYKRSTVTRRIARRMHVHHLESLEQYLEYLRETPAEADLLFRELLIGVTSFFRDPEAYAALRVSILALMEQRPEGHPLRVWVPACSTGEEAYSLAILLHECATELGRPPSYQVFATDLGMGAIESARIGTYPLGISDEVTPERLARYFERHEDVYTIRKEVREKLVFAPQNVLVAPPFTKLDILSCRNLLIYLAPQLQQKLLPIFHYALRPGGILFLGSSESLGPSDPLFATADKRWKVFVRREVGPGAYRAELPIGFTDRVAPHPARMTDMRSEQAIDRMLAAALVPPTVLVREQGDVVHIHGHTGQFLEPAPGLQVGANILNMAREGLGPDLASAMRQAALGQPDGVVRRDVQVKSNGEITRVDLRVRRVKHPEKFAGMYLVSFEPPSRGLEDSAGAGDGEMPTGRMFELQQELRHTKENHQGTIEELETANEELQSTNEEPQSANEELQSTNEELETSREEMQSLNEELQTVNSELERKVEELSLARDDLKNLLNGTEIATVFLDTNLRIKRYTERARRVIPLIPSDVGRPLGDIVSRLHYQRLLQDAAEVLETLNMKEAEVAGEGGTEYLLRILPYRTADNLIDGLVLTFIDISKLNVLQRRDARLTQALESSPTTVATQDTNLRYTWVSGPLFGHAQDAVVGRTDAELLGDAATELSAMKQSALTEGTPGRVQVVVERGDRQDRYDVHTKADRRRDGTVGGLSSVCTVLEAQR